MAQRNNSETPTGLTAKTERTQVEFLSNDRARTFPGRRFERDVSMTRLFPFPGNARRGNVSGIRESLATNGLYRPLVALGEDVGSLPAGTVLVGNNTLAAALSLGWDTVDVYWLTDLDEARARAILLVDNRLNDQARYDDEALVALLGQYVTMTLDDLIGLLTGDRGGVAS